MNEMPRARCHSLTGHKWHITHRCQKKRFLLKFNKVRKQWFRRLYIARKHYRLCTVNYAVTSNHVYPLVARQGDGEIAPSIRLVASCTAQQFNWRKGAIWEDRYSVTAVQCDSHLARCFVCIDLDMHATG
jgi:putative transposase